jgi:hypothetical protein
MGGVGAVLIDEYDRARRIGPDAECIVLVEGASDRVAIATLAHRLDRDLDSEAVGVVAIAGATNIGRFVDLLGPGGFDVRLAGLCDRAEADAFATALRTTGLDVSDRIDMERHGFFTCEDDLEEELIRALGPQVVLRVMESQRQLRSFRRFQNQPAQRGKTIEAQIWRWLGNHKIRYAPLLVGALELDSTPSPLQHLLDWI